MIRIYCIPNSMLLYLNFNVIMKYTCSCDHMEKIIEHMVDYRSVTLLFLPVLLLNVLVIRRHRPHVIIDTQMTVKHEFKILTSAPWRFVVHSIQFSAPCLLKLRKFSLLRPVFEGVFPLGTMPAVTIGKVRYSNSKYIYHVKQNSSLADPVMCCYGQEAKYCYCKVKSLRNPLRTETWLTFGVPRGNHLSS